MGLESASFIDGLVTTNPLAADTVAQGDDHLRLVKSVLKGSFPNIQYARYLEQPRVDVADSATPLLWAALGNYVNLLGATGITGFASGTTGQMKTCVIATSRTLVHNASTLALPGGANIAATAGDRFGVVCEGTTNNRVLWYEKVNGKAIVETFTLPLLGDVGGYLKATGTGVVAYLQAVDVGISALWFDASPPAGWLELNGQEILRSSPLGLLLGLKYGAGNGTTTANVPDMRGYFPRGWAHGAGTDPNAGTRTNRGDGVTGDNIGTKQADEFESHNHGSIPLGNNNNDNASPPCASDGNAVGAFYVTANVGGNETRPLNLNVMFIMKT